MDMSSIINRLFADFVDLLVVEVIAQAPAIRHP